MIGEPGRGDRGDIDGVEAALVAALPPNTSDQAVGAGAASRRSVPSRRCLSPNIVVEAIRVERLDGRRDFCAWSAAERLGAVDARVAGMDSEVAHRLEGLLPR